MTTTNMSLNEPSVGSTSGPTWASETNDNWTSIDQHDHTSGKGVQLTPSALNINSDLEFNGNAATELKRLTIDSSATGSGTSFSVYQSGGNLYWYNGSGQAVQITNGTNVKTTGGSIDGMESTDAGADYGSGYFKWEFDTTKTPFAGAKMKNADIELHKYDGSSGSNAYVILKYTGSSEGSNNLTFPDETGTILSTATSFGGAISIATSASNANISLNPNGTGEVVIGNGSASGKITSNSTQELVLDTNAGTESSSITIRSGVNGNIDLTPNPSGSGEVNISKVDIDDGAIDGTTIGSSSHTTGKFTTCDATTDFTIGGTVVTDGQIADDGNFTFDIDGDLTVDVNGGDVTYKDNGTTFLSISYSGGNTTITGP
jgi:hypothetical protein